MGPWPLEMRGYKKEGETAKLRKNFMNWEDSGLGEELENQNRRARKHDRIIKYFHQVWKITLIHN